MPLLNSGEGNIWDFVFDMPKDNIDDRVFYCMQYIYCM